MQGRRKQCIVGARRSRGVASPTLMGGSGGGECNFAESLINVFANFPYNY